MVTRKRNKPAIYNVFAAGIMFLAILFAAIYAELFYEACFAQQNGYEIALSSGVVTIGSLVRILAVGVVLGIIVCVAYRCRRITAFIEKYRYIVAALFIFICVLFELSQSSIAVWSNILQSTDDTGVLFGIPRGIRSDEYICSTLYSLSQDFNGYDPLSYFIRGTQTDVQLVYNAPCYGLISVFRPYVWGYLAFGFTKGLAFLWALRWSALLLASYELGKIITNNDKPLACAFALFVTFSPIVAWWGTFEVVTYGILLVVSLHRFLRTPKIAFRCLYAVAIAWLCGCYLFTLYPAWMVPFFYVFALMGIWSCLDYYKNRKEIRSGFRLRETLLFIPFVLIVAYLVYVVFSNSSEALALTSNTVYPGKRFETGGGYASGLLSYTGTLFFSLEEISYLNVCELSTYFTLFPIGFLLAGYVSIRCKDKLCILIAILELFMIVYVCFGFPDVLALVSLFSHSTALRMIFALGFCEIVLLFRSCSILRQRALLQDGLPSKKKSVRAWMLPLCAVLVALVLVVLTGIALPDYGRMMFRILAFICLFAMVLTIECILAYPDKRVFSFCFAVAALCCVAIPGMTVNPVQQGAGIVADNDLVELVNQINADNPADGQDVTIVDGEWYYANLLAANGIETLNSTNAYPNFKTWKIIDPEGKYEEAYNRYAHVTVELVEDSSYFELKQPDLIKLYLSVSDLSKLNVKYVVSQRDLQQSDNPLLNLSVVLLGQRGSFYVYEVL